MRNKKQKTLTVLLALCLITPIFSGCNIVTNPNVEPSLPTIPEGTTSEVTTATTSETTE